MRCRFLGVLFLIGILTGCNRHRQQPEVVVYVSVDQVHAEPVLRRFEQQSGIRVRAVYDVEAAKTTGLANRILAERARPQADLFWSGEFVQAIRLASAGALEPAHPSQAATIPAALQDPVGQWFAMGGRYRVLLIHRQLWHQSLPTSLMDFASDQARETTIALPLFGSSAAQAAALYAQLGPDRAHALYQSLRSHGVRVVDGNSVVRDLVAHGRAAAGWTDSDDACEALASGAPVQMVLPDQQGAGTLLIPGTVARVKGAPHPTEANALMDFLLRSETEKQLIASGYFQTSVRPGGQQAACLGTQPVKAMALPLRTIAEQLEPSRRDLERIFNH